MGIKKDYYSLSELEKRWKKYDITALDILHLAAKEIIYLSVWFKGEILIIRSDITPEELDEPSEESFEVGYRHGMIYLASNEVMAFVANDKNEVTNFFDRDLKRFFTIYADLSPGAKNPGLKLPEYRRENLFLEYKQIVELDKLFKEKFNHLEPEPEDSENLDNKAVGIKYPFDMILDKDHPWHSEPLANAVRAWIELYSKRDGDKRDNRYRPVGGNDKYIVDWLDNNVGKVGRTTKEHYVYIINPSKQGGPKKIPE